MSSDARKCFVIMPFSKTTEQHTGEYWTQHFEGFLKPLLKQVEGLEVVRSNPLRADIIGEIVMELATSPVVIADLTDFNPNVFWELGVRQSLKNGTVTIAERDTSIPSLIYAKATLFYPPEGRDAGTEFGIRLVAAVRDCLRNPQKTDSPVLLNVTGRGSLYQILQREQALRMLKAVVSEHTRNVEFRELLRNWVRDKKGRKKKGYPTFRFRLNAVEWLTVTRYLDADDDFYEWSHIYINQLEGWNRVLEMWPVGGKSDEIGAEYFLNDEYLFDRAFKEFESRLNIAKRQLELSA